MPAIDNLKFELEKRVNDRITHQLPMKSIKDEIYKIIEWLFKLLERIDKL